MREAMDHPEVWVVVDNVSPSDLQENPHVDDVLLESSMQSRRSRVVVLVLSTIIVVWVWLTALLLIISFPSPPVFSTCDVRWDVTAMHPPREGTATYAARLPSLSPTSKYKLRAEVQTAVYNPNRFDILMSRASAVARFHNGPFADIEWMSRSGELETIPAGSVWDSRFVLTMEHMDAAELERVAMAFFTPEGIVVTINSEVFVSLRLWGLTLTPRMFIAQKGVQVPLNDANSALCKCDPLPWEGLPSRRARKPDGKPG